MTRPGRKSDLFNDMERIDLGSYEQMSSSLRSKDRFLGELTEKNLRSLMNRSGLTDKLEKRNITEFSLNIFSDESGIDHLGIFDENDEMIIDLRLSKKRFVWGIDCDVCNTYDMIVIEWLSTRNPHQIEFSRERPQLPGQPYPGLGCLKNMLKMMYLFSKKIACDGFLDIPDHLHLSVMYSKSFYFVDPDTEGRLRSLLESLKHESLYTIAWAAVTNAILNKADNSVFVYRPSEQVFPVSRRLKAYFSSKEYNEKAARHLDTEYYINRDILEKNRKQLLKNHTIAEI